jgi:hypothetical protein
MSIGFEARREKGSGEKDFFAVGGQRNPLKRLNSAKGKQGNPGLFLGKTRLGLARLC